MTLKPIHAILAVGVAALAFGGKKKTSSAPASISLTPTSIYIKDDQKASQLILTKARQYADSLKDIHDFSYVDLVGKVIQGISPSTYQVYKSQKLTKDGTLIVEYLATSIGAAFNTTYFGDMSKYIGGDGEGYMSEDLLNDPAYLKWEEFRDKIAPEKWAEFNKFVGFTEDMKNDLYNVTELIKVNDKYPV